MRCDWAWPNYNTRLIRIVVVSLLDGLIIATSMAHKQIQPGIDEPHFDAGHLERMPILHDHNSTVLKGLQFVFH